MESSQDENFLFLRLSPRNVSVLLLSAFCASILCEASGAQPLPVPKEVTLPWGEVTVGKCHNDIELDNEVMGIHLEKRVVSEGVSKE